MTVTQMHNLLLHKLKTSPIHIFLFGQESIRLVPFGNKVAPSKEAIVHIDLCEDLSPAAVADFLDFMGQKPELTRNGNVKLVDTRKTETGSTLILAILPVYLASILSDVFHVSMLYLIGN